MEQVDAFNYLNPNKKNLVYISESKIFDGGKGIFAKSDIKKNKPLIIYFGNLIHSNETLESYELDKENYIKNIAPYLRDSVFKNYVIDPSILIEEPDIDIILKGYIVNDYCNIPSITNINIQKYIDSKDKCNVTIMETKDYPIYYSNRDIKKDEELYTHYGLGYWLIQNNLDVTEINSILKKFKN